MSFLRILALAALAAGLVACHAGASSAKLSLQLTPAAPAASASTQFLLQVHDASGHPLDASAVSLDLVMTTMDMGVTPVALAQTAPGSWTGTGQFAMAGDWDCRVTVTIAGQTQAQTFHFKVS